MDKKPVAPISDWQTVGDISDVPPSYITVFQFLQGMPCKNMFITLLTLFLISFFVASCSNNQAIVRMPSEEKWRNAEENFNKGKYHRAIPFYEQLVLERSSIYVADAQFKLGECYFNRGKRDDLVDAIFEYQEFLRLFADHRLAPDALYRLAQSYAKLSLSADYTQDDTNRAIEHFVRFIERHPLDSRVDDARIFITELQFKLIEKVYLTGYIYFKMKDYPAAELYLNEIIDLRNRDDLEKMSMYYIALIHIDRQESEKAQEAINHLKNHFPDSKETQKAEIRYGRMYSKFFRMIYSL